MGVNLGPSALNEEYWQSGGVCGQDTAQNI
jgi:hypothetical protein